MSFVSACSRPSGSSTGTPALENTRTYLIGGNWKSNGTIASLEKLIGEFNGAGPIPANAEVVVGVPAIHIPICLMQLRDDIEIAAQDCSLTGCGAYTGEIAASQLKDMGITWVILGHSERREGFGMAGEDNELVAKKTKKALEEGLKVMLCIGEKKEEREAGTTMDVCAAQLKAVADVLSAEDWANVSIAYEPVWAIGTGLTATPEMAQETHSQIRQWMSDNVSADVASAVRIQYGGSMKGANAEGLLSQADIDGGLIGGASLTLDFFKCIESVPAP
jgi:triosephosphate isomerase